MKKHPLAIAVAFFGLALVGCEEKSTPAAAAQTTTELSTVEQKVSYGLGLQWGERLAQDKSVQLDAEAMSLGISDALSGKEARISNADMQVAFEELRKVSEAKLAELAQQAVEAGRQFLKDNATREGVVTTESGLQYEVLKAGDGEKPKENDIVLVNYKGMLPDGTVFDESVIHGGPVRLPLNGGVIAGWREGLMLMQKGETAKLFVPSDLAYGDQSPSPIIPANSVLVFELELLDINPKDSQEDAE